MNCLTEALGLSLPGNGSTLATHADRKRLFVEAGHLIVDLARRSAESEVGIINTSRPVVQETKFGPAEIADATLSHNAEERQCQAFRLTVPTGGQPYQMSGWACDEVPVTPEEIACFVDHLALTSAANGTALPTLFANANQHQRPECGGVPVPVPPEGE